MTEEIVKPVTVETPSRPNWMGKMCPILSAQSLSPAPQPTQMVIGGTMERRGPVETCATGCQGPQCMAFLPIQEQDADGKTTLTNNGMCGAFTAPVAINQLGTQLASTMVEMFNAWTRLGNGAIGQKQQPFVNPNKRKG